ncbi:hypothetical protein I2I11_20225 [Pontibacter sp. 172403-2]|uniref:putative phage abortive infection protein n=1 Tax=Pontibacter rufus TaxID=2791028 RepID=UPI0018AFF976|nr:hypothetical protein [Pontibacter sp. 172403-2]
MNINRNTDWFSILGFLVIFILVPSVCILAVFALTEPFGPRDWIKHNAGQIGDTIGGITGPIINFVAGVLVYLSFKAQIKANKEQATQFKRETDDNTFFNMIALHNKKVDSVTFQIASGKKVESFSAFKNYTTEYNKLLKEEFSMIARREISHNWADLSYQAYDIIWQPYALLYHKPVHFTGSQSQVDELKALYGSSDDTWELTKGLLGNPIDTPPEVNSSLQKVGYLLFEKMSSTQRLKAIQEVHSKFYHDHGHHLGHYFRNIHYTLEIIDGSEQPQKYAKIFRAQLSRYELALMYYNALSSMSSKEHVQFLIIYDIFNGLYPSDLAYYPSQEVVKEDLLCRIKSPERP